jgi:hypothetical protein
VDDILHKLEYELFDGITGRLNNGHHDSSSGASNDCRPFIVDITCYASSSAFTIFISSMAGKTVDFDSLAWRVWLHSSFRDTANLDAALLQ